MEINYYESGKKISEQQCDGESFRFSYVSKEGIVTYNQELITKSWSTYLVKHDHGILLIVTENELTNEESNSLLRGIVYYLIRTMPAPKKIAFSIGMEKTIDDMIKKLNFKISAATIERTN